MRSLRISAGSVIVAFALARPSAARAEDPPRDVARAEALFDEGVRLLEQGRFAEACPKLAESEALDPAGGTALDLGFCLEHEGALASAIRAYEEALQMAVRDGRADRQDKATERLASLRERVGRVRVRVAPSVAALSGFSVSIDGRLVAAAEIDGGAPVDWGTHRVVVGADGKISLTRSIDVDEHRRVAEISVGELADGASPPRAQEPEVARASNAAAPLAAVRRDDVGLPARKKTALAFGAAGLAAVGVGTVFGVLAANSHADSDRECPGGACTHAGADAEGTANRQAWISNGGLVAGGILVGVAAYLWLSTPRAAQTSLPGVLRF